MSPFKSMSALVNIAWALFSFSALGSLQIADRLSIYPREEALETTASTASSGCLILTAEETARSIAAANRERMII
jgi:hypothetical protein